MQFHQPKYSTTYTWLQPTMLILINQQLQVCTHNPIMLFPIQ